MKKTALALALLFGLAAPGAGLAQQAAPAQPQAAAPAPAPSCGTEALACAESCTKLDLDQKALGECQGRCASRQRVCEARLVVQDRQGEVNQRIEGVEDSLRARLGEAMGYKPDASGKLFRAPPDPRKPPPAQGVSRF